MVQKFICIWSSLVFFFCLFLNFLPTLSISAMLIQWLTLLCLGFTPDTVGRKWEVCLPDTTISLRSCFWLLVTWITDSCPCSDLKLFAVSGSSLLTWVLILGYIHILSACFLSSLVCLTSWLFPPASASPALSILFVWVTLIDTFFKVKILEWKLIGGRAVLIFAISAVRMIAQ